MLSGAAIFLSGVIFGFVLASQVRRLRKLDLIRTGTYVLKDNLLDELVRTNLDYDQLLRSLRSCYISGSMSRESAIRMLPSVIAAFETHPALAAEHANWAEEYTQALAVPNALCELRMALRSDIRVSSGKLLSETIVESTTESIDTEEDYYYGGSFGEEEGTTVTTTVYAVNVVGQVYEAYNPLARGACKALSQIAGGDSATGRSLVDDLIREYEAKASRTVEVRDRRRGAALSSSSKTHVKRHESSVR
jgi:hypothetical protein